MQSIISRGQIRAVVDSRGGELISLRYRDREYIWTGDPTYWNGHNPILFPAIGFLDGNLYKIGGKSYPLQKHGFARKSEFTPVTIGSDAVTMELTESESTLAAFPFRFRLAVTHSLTDSGFETRFCVDNGSDETMYFQLGGHTGFCLPFTPGQTFSDHRLIFDRPIRADRYVAPDGVLITERVHNYLKDADTLPLSYPLFERDALMLEMNGCRRVTLCDRLGRGVRMDFEDFAMLGIWTPKGKKAPFVCLEPWNGMNAVIGENCEFSGKPHVIALKAGGRYTASFGVTIIP